MDVALRKRHLDHVPAKFAVDGEIEITDHLLALGNMADMALQLEVQRTVSE